MQRIQTSDGLFAAGNPATGVPGTIVTSTYLNDVQEELANAIELAGIALDGGSRRQLYDAIVAIIAAKVNAPMVVSSTPTANVGNLIFVLDRWQWAVWVTTAFYTGYRSLHVGDWYIGSMSQAHRPHEIDGIGGIYDIAAYPSLWAWAQENNHVVAAADWIPSATKYAMIGTTQFRVPDYRNMFPRVAGTDADTANAAGVGVYKADTTKTHAHPYGAIITAATGTGINVLQATNNAAATTASTGTAETAPKHTRVASVILI